MKYHLKNAAACAVAGVMCLNSLTGAFAAQSFSDMPNDWSTAALESAVDRGLISGYNGLIRPNDKLTRAETAVVINRLIGNTEQKDISNYTDVSESDWFYEDMSKAVAKSIFVGNGTKLEPNRSITREELFSVIARCLDLNAGDEASLDKFTDKSSVSDWARASVAALVEAGYVTGSNGRLNPKANITRAEFAQVLYAVNNSGLGDTASDSSSLSSDVSEADKTDTKATIQSTTGHRGHGSHSSSSSSSSSKVTTTEATTETTTEATTDSDSTENIYTFTDADKKIIDGKEVYVANLGSDVTYDKYLLNGTEVEVTNVNKEVTIVKYTAEDLTGYNYAVTPLSYGEYWYSETSDGYKGTLSEDFESGQSVAAVPNGYTASQSGEDKYASKGCDTDAGMYDAVSRATTGYGLGRMSFQQTVLVNNQAQFRSHIVKNADGTFSVVRPDNSEAVGFNSSSTRISGGSYESCTAVGFDEITVAVSKDMLVNAEILKDVDGYSEQAQAVLDKVSALSFDESLNASNVYDYKPLCANGLYGRRVVNAEVDAKSAGNVSEANTTENNKFSVNTKYARKFGDVTFVFYFDDYADMKADSASSNINGDEAMEGKVGEFKDYLYNYYGAKIEYLGEDGNSEPIVAGTKFASDTWISPNHGPVVEVALTNSYDRFKSLGNGVYRITLMANGYKDVVLTTTANFDTTGNISFISQAQDGTDDIDEIKDGTDLTLEYEVTDSSYADKLASVIKNSPVSIKKDGDRNTTATTDKYEYAYGKLKIIFENIKELLTKDTQYTVTFPELDGPAYSNSIHYAPADDNTAEEKTLVYGTMEIPYAEFYSNEGVDYEVDAVSSATTSKWKANTGLVNGTYNKEGENGGGTILGVKYPVAISEDDLAALGENNYNFEKTEEQPTAYKLVTVENGKAVFSSVVGESTAVENGSATLANSSNYGDFQIGIGGVEWNNASSNTNVGTVYGVLLKTDDGKYYALRHLENIWRGTNLAFSTGFVTTTHGNSLVYDKYVEIMGKSITQIVYITDSGYHTIDTNLFVGKKYDGAELKVENSDVASGKTTFTLTGLPSDFVAEYSIDGLDATIANGVIEFANGTKAGGYTLTVTDKNGVYVPITASFEITTSGMPAKYNSELTKLYINDGYTEDDFSNFINNISSVTVASGEASKTYSAAQAKIVADNGEIDLDATFEMKGQKTEIFANDGTYTLTVKASGYTEDLTFNVTKGEVETLIYGTMEIPYADFYSNEGVDYEVDAVSSATTSKWKANTGLVNGTYNKEGENGGGTILGVKYPVAISEDDLAALGENNYSFEKTEEQPTAYKTVTVENGKAVFSSVVGESTAVENGSATLANSSNYGDFQISIGGVEWNNASSNTNVGTVYGVLLKTDDGKYYALRHLENIWRGTNLAFSTGFVTTTHGNSLVYDKYVEIMGKTITQIVYITESGYHTIDTSLFVGKKYDGAELKVENSDVASGKTTFTLTGLPSDFVAEYSIDGLDATIANGVIEFANGTKAGGYTLTVTDKNDVYVPITASFEITTSGMPASYNAESNKLEVADGFSSDDFDNFISNISSVTVASGEASKTYSASQAKIVADNGEINLDATFEMKGQKTEIFANDGTYTLKVVASGYSEAVSFEITNGNTTAEVTALEVATEADEPVIEDEAEIQETAEENAEENIEVEVALEEVNFDEASEIDIEINSESDVIEASITE
jgi:hypothetical protein